MCKAFSRLCTLKAPALKTQVDCASHPSTPAWKGIDQHGKGENTMVMEKVINQTKHLQTSSFKERALDYQNEKTPNESRRAFFYAIESLDMVLLEELSPSQPLVKPRRRPSLTAGFDRMSPGVSSSIPLTQPIRKA
eukprot:scaffold4061_cov108-Cylindrotheca_fusiformis.AAC.21